MADKGGEHRPDNHGRKSKDEHKTPCNRTQGWPFDLRHLNAAIGSRPACQQRQNAHAEMRGYYDDDQECP
jgi:hypothetical protein